MTEPFERLRSALGSRYSLERALGAGGMATVYLAEDLKHHRKVAVKVLNQDLAMSLGADRFLREVSIAASLQHPHILPLYDSGQADGFLYYVMPYVDGPTLRDRLVREHELPIGEAARILRDVADAMTAAHDKGVVHRDLKPENIMLSGRHALVADFGVAKAVSEATGRHTLTTAGVALGTPTYMAPEQATADPYTDHRADLYALGVVGYEMLTGQPPFVRGTPQAMLGAHVAERPVEVTERRASIPLALAELIMRCLEKKPADRPQTAEELLPILEALATSSGGMTPAETRPVRAMRSPRAADEQRWIWVAVAIMATLALGTVGVMAVRDRGTPLPGPQMREPVVVLPFEVRGSDPGLQTLGVDAADRIATAIEGANLGRVVAYRPEHGAAAFTEEVGRRVLRETGAGTLVTGVISQQGEVVQIQARVVRASDLATVWTLGPERGLATDPTATLDAIRERVLGAVGWYLSPATEGQANPGIYQPPPSLEVFRLAVKADELIRTGRPREAIPLLVEGFARDTTWLPGALALASTYGGWQRRDSLLAFLEERRERLYPGDALVLDVDRGRLGSPEQEYRAAMALYTADSSRAFQAMLSSVRARRPAEALRYYELRDTTTAWGRDWQAWDIQAALALHTLSGFEEELELARVAKAREPREYQHWEREIRALAALGRTEEIESVVTESYGLEYSPAPVHFMWRAGEELKIHGHIEAGRAYAERALEGEGQWPDSLRGTPLGRNVRTGSLVVLDRQDELNEIYEPWGESAGAEGLGIRIVGMRHRILAGDTAGALALVDSARTEPMTAYRASGWPWAGQPLYYAAHCLGLLGREDEAVAMLREAINRGWRLREDEPLQWYWAPLADYPPFQELVKLRDGN